jgi:hypothetical protein
VQELIELYNAAKQRTPQTVTHFVPKIRQLASRVVGNVMRNNICTLSQEL